MKRQATKVGLALLLALGCRVEPAPTEVKPPGPAPRVPDRGVADPVAEVDPFIGTGAHGHTFPGATMPFGMVQLSPDSRLRGWDGCSGYHYDDSVVYGFSHTHLSGTGVADYADVSLMPIGRQPAGAEGDEPQYPFAAAFSHDDEVARPGFYGVRLPGPAVDVALTTTARVGIHRYTFDDGGGDLLLDLRHRDEVLESWVEMRSPTRLVGLRRSRSWARDQRVFFAIELSRPLAGVDEVSTEEILRQPGPPLPSWSGRDVRLRLRPEAGEGPLLVKVALSAVDVAGAEANLDTEAPHGDFERYEAEAAQAWREALSAIEVEGGTPAQRRIFYTALYHSMLAPNLFSDVGGRFRGTDGRVHEDPGFEVYTVFSLWDTFRATHPLLTLLQPERTADFVNTMLAHHEHGGRLPMWELWGNYTGTMIGYHAVPVIADAWIKGITGFDPKRALQACVDAADADHLGLPGYRAHGYVPAEVEHESVSKTLEYAYDDWTIAMLAEAVGDQAVHERMLRRSQSWQNLYEPRTGLFSARDNGGWVPDFEPREVNIHYTEANAWQYGFFVPHDIGGLIERHGGPDALARTLDRLFVEPSGLVGRQQVDITGLIGQYAHGNEPSHHTAYLYPYVGQAHKTQARVREILDTLYTDRPDGISGNDDCGQMSSWYVLSALGFYPLAPGRDDYVIGTAVFPRATLNLPSGERFVIEAPGVSAQAKYVQRATLNGRPLREARLRHADVVAGGTLVLHMGAEPNPDWGAIDPPPPLSAGPYAELPTPIVEPATPGFVGRTTVSLALPFGEAPIRYRLDGQPPTADSPLYAGPLELSETTTVTAAAFDGQRRGPWMTATFRRRPPGVVVTLHETPHRSYRAGDADGLVDGRRGSARWRTGGWQGYQGSDFAATIDLGKSQRIREVSAGFLQDARSWIWMPRAFEVEVSRDGKTWRSLGRATHEVPEHDTEQTYVQPLAVRGRARARYVRVRATTFGEIPSWHVGAGHPSFIFVDEVTVR